MRSSTVSTRPIQRVRSVSLLSLAAAVLAAGCGGGDTPTRPGTLALSTPAGASLMVEAGTTGTLAIAVNRGGSFGGEVSLAVEGAPSGVTATLSPAVLEPGATTTQLSVAVDRSVAPGTVSLTVRGEGFGVGAATTTVQVEITRPAPALAVVLAPVQAVVTGTTSSSGGVGTLSCRMEWTATVTGDDTATWDAITWRQAATVGTPTTGSDPIKGTDGGPITFSAGRYGFNGSWYWSWTVNGEPRYIPFDVTVTVSYVLRSTGQRMETAPITISCRP